MCHNTLTATPESCDENRDQGLHSAEGVAYLARLSGWEGDKLPKICVFCEDQGFSETTAFVRSRNGRGYYQVTLNECSCPDWRYRKAGTGQLCKHQKALAAALRRREEVEKEAAATSAPSATEAKDELIAAAKAHWNLIMEGPLPTTAEEEAAEQATLARLSRILGV